MFLNTEQEEAGVSLPVLLGACLSTKLSILKAIHLLTGLEIRAGHVFSGHCGSKERGNY